LRLLLSFCLGSADHKGKRGNNNENKGWKTQGKTEPHGKNADEQGGPTIRIFHTRLVYQLPLSLPPESDEPLSEEPLSQLPESEPLSELLPQLPLSEPPLLSEELLLQPPLSDELLELSEELLLQPLLALLFELLSELLFEPLRKIQLPDWELLELELSEL
jgi:hypothetical protein